MNTKLLKYLVVIPLAAACFSSPAVAGPLDYGLITVENERNWFGEDLQFKFSHRFPLQGFENLKPAIATFNLGYKYNDLFGQVVYASSVKDFEVKVGYHFLSESKGHPFSLSAKLGYNLSPKGHNAVGEISALKGLLYDDKIKSDRIGLGAFCKGLLRADIDGDGNFDNYLFSPGVGLSITVISGLNLVGEVAFPLISPNKDPKIGYGKDNKGVAYGYMPVWLAGLQFWIPDSPHVLSLNVSNAGSYTTAGGTITDRSLRISYEWSTSIHLPVMKESESKADDLFNDDEDKEDK